MLTHKDIQARDALEAAYRAAGEENRFWAVRGIAIQSYARLEQTLGDLYADLCDMNPQVAGITFFRITNSHTRNAIIEELFRHKFAHQFNLFRNSLIKWLRPMRLIPLSQVSQYVV
jgi:hypothetical protein